MAKTHKNIYDEIWKFQSLLSAYKKVRKGKSRSKAVARFAPHLGVELSRLSEELKNGVWRPGGYYQFKIFEPKERTISAPYFRDRIVHHAVHAVLYPIYDKIFIHDSYACRIGKGTHRGVDRVTDFLRRRNVKYCLKADVSKYFASIDRKTLKQIIRRKTSCKRTLWLIDLIIDSSPGDNGIPLGNLTSQLFANIYLNELDYHVKHVLKERLYIRYMDDFVIFGNDRKHLKRQLVLIRQFLKEKLHLQLNSKTQIFPVPNQAVDFLGYRIYPAHRLIRNDSKRRAIKKITKTAVLYRKGFASWGDVQSAIHAWIGHCRHADTWLLRRSIFNQALTLTTNVEICS